MKALTVRLSDALWQQIRAYSFTHDERYNAIVVAALGQYLASDNGTQVRNRADDAAAASTHTPPNPSRPVD